MANLRGVLMAGALVLGAGCIAHDLRPGIVRHETPKQIWAKFHGPDVMIRVAALVSDNSRLIQPTITLRDSAYVVIGDIGDDGTLRIVYPERPGEPHLVRDKKFEAPRIQPRLIFPFARGPFDLPRSAAGYAFVIASSQPLQLEKLAENESWSLFDVYYDSHVMDPRPAIADLAAAISTDVGQVSISYSPYAAGLIGPRARVSQQALPGEQRRRIPGPPKR